MNPFRFESLSSEAPPGKIDGSLFMILLKPKPDDGCGCVVLRHSESIITTEWMHFFSGGVASILDGMCREMPSHINIIVKCITCTVYAFCVRIFS